MLHHVHQDDGGRQHCPAVHVRAHQQRGGPLHNGHHGRLGGPLLLLPDERYYHPAPSLAMLPTLGPAKIAYSIGTTRLICTVACGWL